MSGEKVKVTQYRVSLRRERTFTVADGTANNPDQAARILLAWYRVMRPAGECLVVLGVNGRNNVLGLCEVARGGAHGCAVLPADILQAALAMGARAIIVAHNHPSEDPTPSPEDRMMTRALAEACDATGITLLDHIVVAVLSGRTASVEAA